MVELFYLTHTRGHNRYSPSGSLSLSNGNKVELYIPLTLELKPLHQM